MKKISAYLTVELPLIDICTEEELEKSVGGLEEIVKEVLKREGLAPFLGSFTLVNVVEID